MVLTSLLVLGAEPSSRSPLPPTQSGCSAPRVVACSSGCTSARSVEAPCSAHLELLVLLPKTGNGLPCTVPGQPLPQPRLWCCVREQDHTEPRGCQGVGGRWDGEDHAQPQGCWGGSAVSTVRTFRARNACQLSFQFWTVSLSLCGREKALDTAPACARMFWRPSEVACTSWLPNGRFHCFLRRPLGQSSRNPCAGISAAHG